MTPRPFPLAVAAVILLSARPAAADPAADLAAARAAHAKELARLRQKLLADIDAVIKAERDRGNPTEYLQKERKGVADGGPPPLLPKLLETSRAYLDAKAKADGRLADALEAAGRIDEAGRLRAASRPKGEKPKPSEVRTAADLKKFLDDTVWDWGDADLTLRWDGVVVNPPSEKARLAIRWAAIDRRTAVLVVEKGRDSNKVYVLMFDEDIAKIGGLDWGGNPLKVAKTRRP